MLSQILHSYLELSLQRCPWLAGDPQFVALGIQRPPLSSGTPAAVFQPIGPEPPWLHCGVPSVDTHQLCPSSSKKSHDSATLLSLKLILCE